MAIGSSGRALEVGVASLTVRTVMEFKRVITGDQWLDTTISARARTNKGDEINGEDVIPDGTWPRKRTAGRPGHARVLRTSMISSRHGQGSGKQRPTRLKRQPRRGGPHT
ncbi:hypothetical protein HL42_5289 [Trichophyton rubrum]|nr:hypothetical protein HL42_5289 [Trichophyton rubrum]